MYVVSLARTFIDIYDLRSETRHNLSQGGEAGASVVADLEEPPVLRAQGRSDGNGLPLKDNAPLHS